MEPLAYRIPEAAERVGIGRTKLYEEIAANRVRTIRVGARVLVAAVDLDAYVELLRAEAAADDAA